MSILKRQVNSSSNFASFFIVMTHNSSVNFKFVHFLLRIKGSIQSPNFETFKWFGENLRYCSCYFPNHKSVFLQVLHHFSLSWKMTPLAFFKSNVIYFAQKEPMKVKIWEFRMLRSKFILKSWDETVTLSSYSWISENSRSNLNCKFHFSKDPVH